MIEVLKEKYNYGGVFGYWDVAKIVHSEGTLLKLINKGTPLFEDGSVYVDNTMVTNCENSFILSDDTITTCMRLGGPTIEIVSLKRIKGFEDCQIQALILANKNMYGLNIEDDEIAPQTLKIKFHGDKYPYPTFEAIRISDLDEMFTCKVIQYYYNELVNKDN